MNSKTITNMENCTLVFFSSAKSNGKRYLKEMKNNVVTDCFYKKKIYEKHSFNDIRKVQKFKNRRTFRSNGNLSNCEINA